MPARSEKKDKSQLFYEVNCSAGTERFVQRELRRLCSKDHQLTKDREAGEVLFSYSGDWKKLKLLETADDVFRILPLNVTRPRGILEPLRLREVTELIRKLAPSPHETPLKSFRISAAGTDSKDLVRIRQVLAKETGLTEDQEDGDLLIRIRRSRIITEGWDVLVRLTRRPLHVRAWRTADYRGALSAPIARIMVELLEARESDVFLDPMCGSGTLLVEQLRYRPLKNLIGIEASEKVLGYARENLANIKSKAAVSLICGDAMHLPLENASVDSIAANPPWGEAVKGQKALPELYASLLSEAVRVLKRQGKICLIVQDIKALEGAIAAQGKALEVIEKHQVLQRKGFHPTIVLLKRS